MEEFKVETSQHGEWTVISVYGEVSAPFDGPNTANELRSAYVPVFERLVAEGKTPLLLFDLSHLTFLDSSALSVFVGALKRTRHASGETILVTPDPKILKIFRITKIDQLFLIGSSIEEAVAAYEAGQAGQA